MVIVSSFKAKYNSATGFYEINSDVVHACPYDGGELTYRDRVVRKSKSLTGDELRYLLRRLKCIVCGKLHREIPDIIQPYKHYDSAAIQCVLDGGEAAQDCCAENSTIYRWKRDFRDAEPDITQRLASQYARMGGDKVPVLTADEVLPKIKSGVGRWLPYVMELLINDGHKPRTRFAFCQPDAGVKVASASKKNAEGGRKHEQTIADTG